MVQADRPASAPRIAVAIATSGRPAILAETLAELARQTRQADEVLLCPGRATDLPENIAAGAPTRVIAVPPGATAGLAAQRNRLLDATAADILLFLDDDFFVAPGYIAAVEAAFNADPALVGVTGTVLADGAWGPGLTPATAREVLDADQHAAQPREPDAPQASAYGCNMAFRTAAIRAQGLRFDENLPLYSWQEDNDFSRRLGRHGRILRLGAARGVHLAHKSGRISGVRFGYSQVANFVYLMRKGSLPVRYAVGHIMRNIVANIAHCAWPEPWVDRRGRLRGNAMALVDLLRGRCDPRRITSL